MRISTVTRVAPPTTPEAAWYLGCGPEQVSDRVILVGDRGRARRIAERLSEVVWLNEDRGLTLATGSYNRRPITVSAFGMGAPVAAMVMHELLTLGARTFLRLGTVLCLPPVGIGHLVLADAALREEATSGTYVPGGYPAASDHDLAASLRSWLGTVGRPWHAGVVASEDGFYTRMFPSDELWSDEVEETRARLEGLGILGMDMETSTVLTVARRFAARAASLLLATVDASSRQSLPAADRDTAEHDMITIGLETLAALDPDPAAGAA
jgi:uridine phosphorylase